MRLVDDEVVEVVGGNQQLSGAELPSVPVRWWCGGGGGTRDIGA